MSRILHHHGPPGLLVHGRPRQSLQRYLQIKQKLVFEIHSKGRSGVFLLGPKLSHAPVAKAPWAKRVSSTQVHDAIAEDLLVPRHYRRGLKRSALCHNDDWKRYTYCTGTACTHVLPRGACPAFERSSESSPMWRHRGVSTHQSTNAMQSKAMLSLNENNHMERTPSRKASLTCFRRTSS